MENSCGLDLWTFPKCPTGYCIDHTRSLKLPLEIDRHTRHARPLVSAIYLNCSHTFIALLIIIIMQLSLLFTIGCFALHQSPATSSLLRGGPTTSMMLDLSAPASVEEEERIDVDHHLTLFHNLMNGTMDCDCNNMPIFGFNGSTTVPFLKKKSNNIIFTTLIGSNNIKQPAVQISDTIAPLASSQFFNDNNNNHNRGSGAYWNLVNDDDAVDDTSSSVIASLLSTVLDDLNDEEDYHADGLLLLPVTSSPKVPPPLSRHSRTAKIFKNDVDNKESTTTRSWTHMNHHDENNNNKSWSDNGEGSSSTSVLALLMASVLADLHATKVVVHPTNTAYWTPINNSQEQHGDSVLALLIENVLTDLHHKNDDANANASSSWTHVDQQSGDTVLASLISNVLTDLHNNDTTAAAHSAPILRL